jgi:hypothetical protein
MEMSPAPTNPTPMLSFVIGGMSGSERGAEPEL